MPAGRPDAEVDVDEALVRRLIATQHPDLNHLELAPLDAGWDNVLFRLGDELVVRVPRREVAAGLVDNEQTWLPTLAPRLSIPIPAPVRRGEPTDFYTWPWSVVPWFEGECADVTPVASAEADRFADFLMALHQAAPLNAPKNPVRGVPLRAREANTLERMARLREKTDLVTPDIERLWRDGLAAPEAADSRWVHGDLHAQNVLVDGDGAVSAVIDWGDLNGGDVATDLAGIWAVFESADDRARILHRYGPDDALLARSKGWAVVFGVVLTDSGLINSPRHAAAGEKILKRLVEDSGIA
jgi:aminoglycoside phosphotransferase (APT) family kinase protein